MSYVTNVTDIVFVVDRSGSMSGLASSVRESYNQYLRDQQTERSDQCFVTFNQFDDIFECVCARTPVNNAPFLSIENYVPRGRTALYDAIVRAISEQEQRILLLSQNKKPDKNVLVIFSDGLENSSKEYKDRWSDIARIIIQKRDEEGWVILYLGANQDAIAQGSKLGIKADCSLTYSANAVNNSNVFKGLSAKTLSYRSAGPGGQSLMSFDAVDRDLAIN